MDFRQWRNYADVHEGTAVWLITYFLGSSAKSYYKAGLGSREDAHHLRRTKDQKIARYSESMNYVLSTYVTIGVNKEVKSAVRILCYHCSIVQEC